MCAGMVVLSNSGNIAKLLGDPVAESGAGSKTGLAIAIISFWIIDAFTNSLQVCRSGPSYCSFLNPAKRAGVYPSFS